MNSAGARGGSCIHGNDCTVSQQTNKSGPHCVLTGHVKSLLCCLRLEVHPEFIRLIISSDEETLRRYCCEAQPLFTHIPRDNIVRRSATAHHTAVVCNEPLSCYPADPFLPTHRDLILPAGSSLCRRTDPPDQIAHSLPDRHILTEPGEQC